MASSEQDMNAQRGDNRVVKEELTVVKSAAGSGSSNQDNSDESQTAASTPLSSQAFSVREEDVSVRWLFFLCPGDKEKGKTIHSSQRYLLPTRNSCQ